jgi:hypothetical protein
MILYKGWTYKIDEPKYYVKENYPAYSLYVYKERKQQSGDEL